ncbi:MAG: [FeFe] hydrogenase H-cluster radical SAM maturase HydE [Treponema sp.]|nr:[FeFe] hydrogenase H-cluster radical SAM maturase HydE [Treponema sp.]
MNPQPAKFSDSQLKEIFSHNFPSEKLFSKADCVRRAVYGDDVYIRGLIEFTNHCKNNCYYCGIRAQNSKLSRYRLCTKQILDACKNAYIAGCRTFVLQGGEDPYFTDEILSEIIKQIKAEFSDCTVTLSIGERSLDSYQKLFNAGAQRFLLRHETRNPVHYAKLHPADQTIENRVKCLFNLKKTGYQTGSGFMVGSPGWSYDTLIEDIKFLRELDPDMIGIGPFIHHDQTPFAGEPDGDLNLTLKLISILRLEFPHALIPSTTALGVIAPDGIIQGLKSGANVIMPNFTPKENHNNYSLYNGKENSATENSTYLNELSQKIKKAGYRIVTGCGDVKR